MQNQIQVFSSKSFGQLEVLMIGDKPYFPAKDCAATLGYKDTTNAIKQHCRWVVKHHLPHPQSPNKTLAVNFIPEGDLYRLIIRSKLPAAEQFERFVFDEVLPTIRKTGAYVTDALLQKLTESEEEVGRYLAALTNERNQRRAIERQCGSLNIQVSNLNEENKILESCIGAILPSAEYCNLILQCKDAIPITVIASAYGFSAVRFNKLLHKLGIQRRVGGTWVLYSRYHNNGYTVLCSYPINAKESVDHTYWTQNGRKFLYDTLKMYGILPEVERLSGVETLC